MPTQTQLPRSQLAREHYRLRAELAIAAVAAALREWRTLEPNNLDGSWLRILARILTVLVAAQRNAAGSSDGYVREYVRQGGGTPNPAGRLNVEAFVGHAADGRDLPTLLNAPLIGTKLRIRHGETARQALRHEQYRLARIIRTEVEDAGRVADGVAITAEPAIAGYERVVTLPACGRCIVLAGRLYRWSTGFDRHPQCDCTHRPVTADEWRGALPGNTPDGLFEQMTREQQDRAFTKAGAEAIRLGADPSRVVNARRGMSTTVGPSGRRRLATTRVGGRDVFATTERAGRRVRLMPEQILLEAADDRELAVRLLRRYGYVL